MTPSLDNNIPEELELKQVIARDKWWMAMGIVGFVMIVGVVGGVAYYAKIPSTKHQISNNKTEIATEIPKESQKPEIEQQSYTVEILNGSGVTGAAKAAEAALKSKIINSQILKLEVTTGNGEVQTGTTIEYKSDGLRRSSLAGILNELYPTAKSSVEATLVSDVRVILGK